MTGRKRDKERDPLGTGLEELLELMEREVDDASLGIQLDAIDDPAGSEDSISETARDEEALSRVEGLFRSGLHALKARDYVVAAAHFLAVTLLDPGHIKALNNLGVSWFYLKRPEEAERAFKKILEYDPQNETAKKNIEKISKNSNEKEASK